MQGLLQAVLLCLQYVYSTTAAVVVLLRRSELGLWLHLVVCAEDSGSKKEKEKTEGKKKMEKTQWFSYRPRKINFSSAITN